jgi:hypothetical protein
MNSPCCFFRHAILTIPAAAFLNCALVKHRKPFLVSADSDWFVRIERSPTVWRPYYPTPVSTGNDIQPADEAGPTAGLTTLSVLLRPVYMSLNATGVWRPVLRSLISALEGTYRLRSERSCGLSDNCCFEPLIVVTAHPASPATVVHLYRVGLQAQARPNPGNFKTAQSIEG